MSSLPTVLLATFPEHGQANVQLAIAYELALAGVNVCITSFPSLRGRVSRVQQLVDHHASRLSDKINSSITFYAIEGITPNWDAQAKYGINDANLPHAFGLVGAVESYAKIGSVLYPWDSEEYTAVIARVREIIATTKPVMVGVDPIFFAAQDACTLAGQKFMIISPTGLKEAITSAQPCMAAFWKYPALSSGFSFPLRWWQIIPNIYLLIRLTTTLSMSSKPAKRTAALRKSLGIKHLRGVQIQPGIMYISPALTEIDFPFTFIPDELLPCGPIILPFDPLEKSDPVLTKWLDNGPTVLVNLGSHVVADEKIAREMVGAFRMLLDHHDKRGGSKRIQVLWKAKADGDIQGVIDGVAGEEVKEGRVKVVAWLDAEPVSILQHPNIVCTVHHGGANSFYEGVWSGVPHIVLPVWFDTYDYARRAEFLNIGIFGNQTSAPGISTEELGNALVRVTGDSAEAVKFRTSAQRLKDVCRAKGVGRELASAAILRVAGARK